MIILRRFIMANIAVNVAPLIASPNTTTPLQLKQATNKGIANALYFYLQMQKILLLPSVYPSVGILSTVPPVPGVALASLDVVIPSPDLLASLLDGVTGPPTPDPSTSNTFFQAIATWLTTPPMAITLNTPLCIPPTIFGTSIVNFPLMPSMGLVSFYSMLAAGASGLFSELFSKNPLEAPYEILSNFIYAGLLANYITPIPTTGTIGAAYSGMTFPIWIMLDIPDFPIGENDLPLEEVLEFFGLIDLNDETILAKQQEILDGLVDPVVPPSNCSLIYSPETSSYSKNPDCDKPVINAIHENGCNNNPDYDKPIDQMLSESPETSAKADTVWKVTPDSLRNSLESSEYTSAIYEDFPEQSANACSDLLNNAQIDNINDNYSDIDSNALATPAQDYTPYELEFVNINIGVLEPTVTAVNFRPAEKFTGIDPGSVVVTNRS